MRVLLAFDKFKDGLTAQQACEIAARAIRAERADWTLDLCPLADGGEGFAEILTAAAGGEMRSIAVHGPRGRETKASYGLVPSQNIPRAAQAQLDLGIAGNIAVIEMAAASGLALLPPALRDPWECTSYGTGQLIRAATEAGATAVLLGVGGSATNDLGLGALAALGLEFHSDTNQPVHPPIPARWPAIATIVGQIARTTPPIRIACDVTNPLLGPRGAAATYGPQKGLRPQDLGKMEHEAERLARLLCAHCGKPASLLEKPGTGAAGGISFGLMTAAGAELLSGFDLVAAWLDLETRVAAADLVVTGEGRFDASSLQGKGPGAVAARALALGKHVHVFAGAVTAPPQIQLGLHAITPPGMSLEEALRTAPANLEAAVTAALAKADGTLWRS